MKKIKYKKHLEGVVILIITYIIIKIRKDKKILKTYEKQKQLIHKQESVLRVYESWMNALQNKKSISGYLMTHNYRHIAIYGLGRLGKHLYEELMNSGINVSYVIDRNYSVINKYYKQVYCYNPEDKLPSVDMIIVTVPGEEKEIVASLKKKNAGSVKTMNDLLFVL